MYFIIPGPAKLIWPGRQSWPQQIEAKSAERYLQLNKARPNWYSQGKRNDQSRSDLLPLLWAQSDRENLLCCATGSRVSCTVGSTQARQSRRLPPCQLSVRNNNNPLPGLSLQPGEECCLVTIVREWDRQCGVCTEEISYYRATLSQISSCGQQVYLECDSVSRLNIVTREGSYYCLLHQCCMVEMLKQVKACNLWYHGIL